MRDVTVVILGGGQGRRLRPLTCERAKPAVPVGGKYRLIDISISNCINSGLRRIFVLTQFMSASLHKHIQQTYRFDTFSEDFVHILAAQETPERMDWFQGTADAVRRIQRHIAVTRPRLVLVLSGDQIYRADFAELVEHHDAAGAEATLGVVPVAADAAAGMGLVEVDASGRVVDFVEKPEKPKAVKGAEAGAAFLGEHGIAGRGPYLVSMGVYLFEAAALATMLADSRRTDFGGEVLPEAIGCFKVSAWPFGGYWRDVGTIGSFYEANLEFTGPDPPFSFHEPGADIFTRARHLPLSRIRASTLDRALVAEGCVIDSAEISRSVVGIRTRIGPGTRVSDSVLLGTDFYEPPEDVAPGVASSRRRQSGYGASATGQRRGPACAAEAASARRRPDRELRPAVGIGRDCRIERAIVDKNARIGDGVEIRDKRGRPDFEGTNHWIRDGIVVIPKGAVLRAGTKI
jgi:glucose-1-phosphate adenylyltransferase